MSRTLSLLVALVVLHPACYRTRRFAAPPIPTKLLPDVSLAGTAAPGLSRVILDVAEGPAVVESVSGGSVSGVAGSHALGASLEISRRVCVTPCILDTSPGAHELRFTLVEDDTRTSTGFVNVDQRVSAYRHALGRSRNTAWRGFLGWPILLTGVVLDIGGITAASRGDTIDGPFIATATLAIGLTVLGGWLVHGSVIDKQPGSGVQWHPE